MGRQHVDHRDIERFAQEKVIPDTAATSSVQRKGGIDDQTARE